MSGISQEEYLRFRTEMGARAKYGADWADNAEVVDRLKTELDLIVRKGYASYFLMLGLFLERVRKEGIIVGPGRGSSGGCLVAYVLDIVEVDPLKYDLLFSRFLAEERTELPDIDVDFSQERRPEVLELARDFFGRDKTIQIGAFQRYGWKATLGVIGAIAGMTKEEIGNFHKLVPDGILGGRKIAQELHYIYDEVADVRDWMEAHPSWARTLMAADGGYQHLTRHAAGILVMDDASRATIPLTSPDGTTMVTGWDMYDVERMNLLKLDFLGLRTLDIIHDACEYAGIKESDIDHDVVDEKTRDLLAAGDTQGVFQVEGWGYTKLCQQLKPETFEQVAALNALYRPGCLEAYVNIRDGEVVDDEGEDTKTINMVDLYVERTHGRVTLTYEHPDLEPILGSTQGIILYQEQAMRIAVAMAGFTENEADKLRKAIGKKRLADMEALEPKFIDGVMERYDDERLARLLWDNIAAASRYSWNKSHAVAYGIITFRCAYLKANYPVAFYAALLRSLNDRDKIADVISEMKIGGVPLAPPSINNSGIGFEADGDSVRFGLLGISGLGQSVADQIIAERSASGDFVSLVDFMIRCSIVPVNVVESLIAAGAFDNLPEDVDAGRTRAFLMTNARTMKANTKLKKKQHPLADELLNDREMLEKERQVLGFFVSSDPFEVVRDLAARFPAESVIFGTLSSMRTKIDKNGNEMAFASVDHPEDGRISTTIFSKTWASSNLQRGQIVVFSGEHQEWQGRKSFAVNKLEAVF